MECGVVLDSYRVLNLIETDLLEKGINLLTRKVSMLTNVSVLEPRSRARARVRLRVR